MWLRFVRAALSAALPLLAACGDGSQSVDTLTVQELRDAPTDSSIANTPLLLEANVWRNFMPGPPPDERRLIVSMRIRAAAGTEVPSSVWADAAWVIHGEEVWATPVAEEQPRSPSCGYYEVMARNGPLWEPGSRVEVIVRLRDAAGNTVLLRAPDLSISAPS